MAKKNFAAKRKTKKNRLRWFFILVVTAILLSGFIFLLPIYKTQWQRPPIIATYYAKVVAWVATRKSHLHQGLIKVKQLAVNKNSAEPEVHFEFYTALPNMQVNATLPSVAQPMKPSPAKDIAAEIKLAKPSVLKMPFDAVELEQDFSKQLAKKK